MKNLSVLILLFFILAACTSKQKTDLHSNPFHVKYIRLTIGTPIKQTLSCNGYYLLQLDNSNYAVLDSYYQHRPEMEKNLSNTGTQDIFKIGDTTILSSQTRLFYLTKNWALKPYIDKRVQPEQLYYGDLFLEDSLYQIYGCCIGEFGGSLFLYNKNSKRLYFYKAGCVDQVVYFHNSYYVFANWYNASYTKISYPEKLTELKYKNRLFDCNWWAGVDSLKDYNKNKKQKIEGFVKYKSSPYEHSLYSFIHNDTLFTIVSRDSSTCLAMHQGDSLKMIQVLINKRLGFDHIQFSQEAGASIISFSAYMRRADAQVNIGTDSIYTGFFIIHERDIDIGINSTKYTYQVN